MRAEAATASRRLDQSKPPACLLDRRDLFWQARIHHGRGVGRGEAEQLFAVQIASKLGKASAEWRLS